MVARRLHAHADVGMAPSTLSSVPREVLMGKPAPVHHHSSHGPRDVLLPIVTLGFYGLRRFRPRSLYNFTALLILAAWLAATVVVYSYHRSEEHTSELQSRFGISYAVFCLKKQKQ